jgi:NADPH:quinone reductase-like Zn-dependent oxidoreductase
MMNFNAFVLTKGDKGQDLSWRSLNESDLMEGDVTVRISHSTINYKDGLALTGKAPVVRRWPMIPPSASIGWRTRPRISRMSGNRPTLRPAPGRIR